MVASVRIVLLLLVSFVTTGTCSWWNIASNILQAAVDSVDESNAISNDEAVIRRQDALDRIAQVLGEHDNAINVDARNSSPIGWKDVFHAGSKLSQYVMGAIDDGALNGVIPDLTAYGLDFEYVKRHINTWNWEKFTEDLMTRVDEGAVANDDSRQVDSIMENIRSFESFQASEEANAELPPECFMTVPQMVRFAGYPCAVYKTVTKDGYELTMHRIPFGSKWAEKEDGRLKSFEDQEGRKPRGKRTRRGRAKRPVVFLQHGILSDSSCWVSNGPTRSLAFILADAGFDVWMGNIRGNTYSRAHVDLNPDTDERFWRFSWQQMSEFDLPAMVDAVLRTTAQEKLYYIGHSQGTLIAFARLAEDPSFNEKLHMMFALAPVATLGHIRSPIKWMSGLTEAAQFGVSLFGGAEILPSSKISKWLSAKLHNMAKDSPLTYHGQNLLLFLAGFNINHYHEDRLPVFLAKTPSGTSLHNFIHMSQLVTSGRTQKWDYGTESENVDSYGEAVPPEYDVSKITTPLAIFLGSRDDLADPRDGRNLASSLRSMVHFRMIRGWDHLDFLWGKEAPLLLYPDIVGFIKENESPKRSRKSETNTSFRHVRGVDDEL